MNEIKISVIVPVYNVEKYLKRCLNSILSQNLKEIEVIIINDCSIDSSLKIIQEYMKKDKRIILINKEKNEGISSARNSGLKIAKGKYILQIDSDDWIEQDYFKDMYNIASKNNADIVISDFFHDYNGKKIVYKIDQYGKREEELTKRKIFENLGKGKSAYSVWNKLVKREIYENNKIKFIDGTSAGDDLVVTPILFYNSNKIIKLNKAYLHYMQNPNSITKKPKYSELIDVYNSLNELEKFFKNKGYDYFLKDLRFTFITAYIFKVKPKFKVKLYNKILEEFLLLLEERKNIDLDRKNVKYYNLFRKLFQPKSSFIIVWILFNLKYKIKLLLGI